MQQVDEEVWQHGVHVVDVQNAVMICDQVYSSGEHGGQIQEQALISSIHSCERRNSYQRSGELPQ